MSKAYYIFLDDIRVPKEVTWIWIPAKPFSLVRCYDEFTQLILNKGYLPKLICFDHDLADQHYIDGVRGHDIKYTKYKEKTGYDCALWLINFCEEKNLAIPEYIVHSMNPVGAKNIRDLIESYRSKKERDKINNK